MKKELTTKWLFGLKMIMNNVKISLVFCCYNVSSYLDDIYSWLRQQPYENIEVVFVEDCSTDDTKDKLYSIVNDPRMRIIENKKNMGLSESRNIGLSNVTGEYVGFPDPDDMFANDWLVNVAIAAECKRPEVIISGMREDYENDNVIEYSKDIVSNYNGLIEDGFEVALLDLERTMLFGYMNNKLYKTDFLIRNNIICKTMALKEDFDFNIEVFKRIDVFYIINKPVYFYKKRRNGNTLTSKFVPEYFDIHEKSVFAFIELLENKSELTNEAQEHLVNRFYRYFLSAVERNMDERSTLSLSEQNQWIKNVLNNPRYAYFLSRNQLINGKFRYVSFIFRPQASVLLIILARFIKMIKNRSPILFAKLK